MNKPLEIGIDNSCIEQKSIFLLKELKEFTKKNAIFVRMGPKTRRELKKWGKTDNEEIIRLCNSFIKQDYWDGATPLGLSPKEVIGYRDNLRGFTSAERIKIFKNLKTFLLPQGYVGKKSNNDYLDIRILAEHIAAKRDYFISKDSKMYFKNDNNKKIEKIYPQIKIRIFDESFISELKNLNVQAMVTNNLH